MSTTGFSASELPRIAADLLDTVRAQTPRVHCLMNTVVQKFVADGLSALNAVPSMTSSPEEVQAFVRMADALVVNLGTLDRQRREAITLALDAAKDSRKPWVLDPAHCDYSPVRTSFTQELLKREPSVLRANASEHAVLQMPEAVVSIQTGVEDTIAHAHGRLVVENGHKLMTKVTGTGCLSGAIIAAFLAVEPASFKAAASAMLVIGVTAEIASSKAQGPASFEVAFIDSLAGVSADDILQHARVRND